jgi:diguanylate cyclase (GGDEF)-like protein
MSGLELCWEIRLIATNHRPIYVILMSATMDDNSLIEALDSGADDFLRKPPVPEELYARLRAAERLTKMQRELIRLATIDPLTGLFNRRAFFDKAKAPCAQAEVGVPLSAIMLDIDNFKRINDVYGHGIGDEAICAVAQEINIDRCLVGRLGGEEFAVLLDGRAIDEAMAIAESLRGKLATLQIESGAGTVTLTCSFGVNQWQRGDTIDRLLKRADMALYAAKLGGRNRVVAADHTMLVPSYPEIGRSLRVRKTG